MRTFLNLLGLFAWCVCNFCKYFNLTRQGDIFLGRALVSCTFLCKFVLYLFTLIFSGSTAHVFIFDHLTLTKEDKREFQISQLLLSCFIFACSLLDSRVHSQGITLDKTGNPAVQWLGLGTFTSEGLGLIPGWEPDPTG